MNCREVTSVLEEYFDGELDEHQRRQTAAHLVACATCAAAYAGLQREQELFMHYERDVEVTPQLWHGIQARIAGAQVAPQLVAVPFSVRIREWFASALIAPRFSPALTAALVALAIALTVGVMKFTTKGERASTSFATMQSPTPTVKSQQTAAPSPQPSIEQTAPAQHEQDASANNKPVVKPRIDERTRKHEARARNLPITNTGAQYQQVAAQPHEPTPDDLVKDAEAKYQKAIEILNRDVKGRRSALDAVTLARYDETLKSLDRTIAETRRVALGRNNDPVAVQYMLTAYAKKIEVLREMARN